MREATLEQAQALTYAVVIPCYNAHKYLGATLESVFSQTLSPSEVLVVDDGSTDPVTLQYIENLKRDARITVISKPNGGLSSARNAGIEQAKSDVILPLDADDLIAHDYAERALRVMSQGGEKIVYGRAELFGSVERSWDLPEFSASRLLFNNMIYASAFFPRSAWVAVGGYNDALRHGREDHDFWIRTVLGLGLAVHRLDQVVFFYRQHEISMNRSLGESRTRLVDTYAEIFSSNSEIYARHAREVVGHHLRMVDRINDNKHRYGKLERALEGDGFVGRTYQVLRKLKQLALWRGDNNVLG
ncbi:MAG: glycosyltransferase [Micrococcus sp.]|nr:glycosyltransferase [Micrococcus sp.]